VARQSPAFYGELSLAAHEPETIDNRKHERNMPEKRAVLIVSLPDDLADLVPDVSKETSGW
jgi:hypothetical protein